jgi:hypothetical protein
MYMENVWTLLKNEMKFVKEWQEKPCSFRILAVAVVQFAIFMFLS